MTTPRKARQVAASAPFPVRLGRLGVTVSRHMVQGTLGALAVIATLWALGTVLPLFNGLAHTLAHHGCGVPVSLNFLALGFFAFVLGVHLFSVQKRAVGEQALAWRRSAK